MKTLKDDIISGEFEGKPTRFGKIVVETAKHPDDDAYWEKLYDAFLNMEFWVPVVIKGKGTKRESYHPILSVHKNGKQNLVIFEKKSRAATWHENNKKKVAEDAYVAKYDSGYDIIKTWPAAILKQYDLYIDFGKSTFLILSPEKVLWLRKAATKLEE